MNLTESGDPATSAGDREPVTQTGTPPVGLNWHELSAHLGVERVLLERDGAIVLRGEYFPESGYVFDPVTLEARLANVGEIALRTSLFLGELSIRDFRVRIKTSTVASETGRSVIPSRARGPIIGLFSDPTSAQRAKQRIMEASISRAVTIQEGPLGTELRVGHVELGGRVATIIANHGGAIIAVEGEQIPRRQSASESVATGSSALPAGTGTPPRGTGVTGEAQVPYGDTGL